MKVEKNKIVVAAVLATVILFLISYSVMILGADDMETEYLKQTLIPKLDEQQKEYNSKLDAINDLKEVRETNAPSIYDEKHIDSLGFYDADLPEKEKERIIDSIYTAGRINYSKNTYENLGTRKKESPKVLDLDSIESKAERKIETKEMGLEHQLFFASAPQQSQATTLGNTDATIYAVVNGDQVVEVNSRLRMRLTHDATINGNLISKNTPIFGFISFQPNRALITIENIDYQSTHLQAFDFQDGSPGIYVENNFRAEATNEVLDDVLQDINIPTIPQIGGISQILRRNNRNVKVTILNNYKLIIKPKR